MGQIPSVMISTSDAVRLEGPAPCPWMPRRSSDGDHYAAHVVAKEFAGKTRVQQHKMVYEALQGRMGGVLHALALTTAAPKD